MLVVFGLLIGLYTGRKLGIKETEHKLHVISGKAAKRFYKTINQGGISEKQQKFLDDSMKQLKKYEM